MQTNYVLIDYENVQPSTLALLDKPHVRLIVFVGAAQAHLPFALVAALQPLGERVEYIKITGNGPNALDFHIAFYIGQLSAREPEAAFHIVSNDTGFDPLIQHLQHKKVHVKRWGTVPELPDGKTTSRKSSTPQAAPEQLAAVVTDLQRRGTSRPRTVAALASTINALFRKQLTETDVAALVHALQVQGVVTIRDTQVTYVLPT